MDQGSSLNNIFDFNSQAGVMSLLSAIRVSGLNPAEKNELRDLVFLYTNGGGDASVRIALEQKLVAHNIKPVAGKSTPVQSAPAVILPFGSSRPSPVFNAPVQQVATPVSAPAPVTQPAPAQPVPVVAAPVVPPTPASVSIPASVVLPTPVQAPAPVTAVPPVVEPLPPIPDPVPVSALVVPPTPAPAPAVEIPTPTSAPAPVVPAPVAQPNTNFLDRIREIKIAVNSKVGNPVNLVDINNEVGREYMNALLEAMKRLSGGGAGQIEAAMVRLETAYQAVEVAVAEHNENKTAAAAAPAPVASAPIATPNPTPVPEVVMPTPASVVAPVTPVQTAPTPAPAARVETQSAPVTLVPSITELKPTPSKENEINAAAPGLEANSPSNIRVMSRDADFDSLPKGPSGFEMAAQKQAVVPVPQPHSLAAEEAKVLTPKDLPLASSLATSATGDPLNTKEVDDGLEQLLSDWILFKKSGLFGTGPKGREHPLFKKIAGLQIPLLLAGRFEGSTQEIKQSITDYMNGWRYEQGIIYEQGETFEHYLRRVIKQILDLQKKRRPG